MEGLIRLMNGAHSGPINIGNPGEFMILKLAELVRARINPQFLLIIHPLQADDPLQRQPVIGLVQQELGWQPSVPLEQGLELTIAWFKSLLEENVQQQ